MCVFENVVCLLLLSYVEMFMYLFGIVQNLFSCVVSMGSIPSHAFSLHHCKNDFPCTQTHAMTHFVFLSLSTFLSPGILPSSLDGKKFM